jgi:DNA-binding response OmpR family regulator
MAHVLVLEPDVKLAALYRQALRSRRHTVGVAATAQDAISQADSTKPDVVVLELQLTGHSGIEFLYEFRTYTDWSAIPAIILSNVPQAEFAQSQQMLQQRLGVVSYHYKPRTSLQSLLHAIENSL